MKDNVDSKMKDIVDFQKTVSTQVQFPNPILLLTCFFIGLSNISGALSLLKVVTKGSLLAETNLAITDFLN